MNEPEQEQLQVQLQSNEWQGEQSAIQSARLRSATIGSQPTGELCAS